METVHSGNLVFVGKEAKKLAEALKAFAKTRKGKLVAKLGQDAGRRTVKMLQASGLSK